MSAGQNVCNLPWEQRTCIVKASRSCLFEYELCPLRADVLGAARVHCERLAIPVDGRAQTLDLLVDARPRPGHAGVMRAAPLVRAKVGVYVYVCVYVCVYIRAAPLVRVKAKMTVTITVHGCPRPVHTALLTVNLTLTRKSGAALKES